MVQSPWIIVNPEVAEVARRYRVPIHVIASVKGVKPEIVAKAYRTAHQREYYDFLAAASNRISLFGRPVALKAERKHTKEGEKVYITISYPTTRIVWQLEMEEFAKKTPEEWIRDLTEWIYAKAERVEYTIEKGGKKKRITYWKATKVAIARAESDTETAKHLIERYHSAGLISPVLYAGAALLGYIPRRVLQEPMLQLLAALYLLPIVSPEPIHMVLLSVPGIGKTTTAVLYHDALKWEFFNEPPSLASLVGDARTGRSAIAGSEGIWFDEFDKWETRRRKAEDLAEIIEVLLTGMEQGLWKRSKGGEKKIEVQNSIPVVLTGNIAAPISPRAKLKEIISKAAPDASEAFNQRVAVAVTLTADLSGDVMSSTWESVIGKPVVTRPSVLRGYREYVQSLYHKAPEPSKNPFKGRFARSYRRVYKALAVLFTHPHYSEDALALVEDLTKKLVKGAIIATKDVKAITTA